MMEVDWTYTEEASKLRHQAVADMESSRETEEGKAQKHMALGPTGGHAKIRKDMATAGEGSTGQSRGLWRTLVDYLCPSKEQRA